jgi:tetratricopeptide (TPR) repeat protein
VFPFSVPGSPEFLDLSEGVMDLVGRSLDGVGELHRVDPNVLMSRLPRLQSTDAPELEAARHIARELGAGHFILGRVVDLRDRVQLSASLYTLSSGAEPEQSSTHEGRLNDLSSLVDSVARDLLTKLPAAQGVFATQPEGDEPRHPVDEEEHLTSSYRALRDYMRGAALLRGARWDSAAVYLDSAVRQDSTFASAWLLLAESRSYAGADAGRMLATWDRAFRYRDRLSKREHAWLLTGYAFAHGDGPAANKAAVAMVNAYPDAAEGWYYLGDGHLWYAWQLGRAITEGDSAFERALTLDPQYRPVQIDLALLRYAEGRKAEGDSLWLAGYGSRLVPPEDSAGRRQFLAMLETQGRAEVVNEIWVIGQVTDRLGDAARLAALLTDPRRGPESAPAVGHHLAGWVAVARGRWFTADSEFSQASRLEAGMGVVERAWLGTMPLLARDTAWLRRRRAELLTWTPRSRGPNTSYLVDWRLSPWLTPHANVYALGLLSARLGDRAAAFRYAAQLDAARDPHDSLGLLHDLALEVQALDAAEQEQWGTCLGILERQGLRGHAPVADEPIFNRRAFGRLLRADALFHLGRDQEALEWYGTFWLQIEFALLAPVQLREGEIYEREGDARAAVAHYRRFLARWGEADSLYQPLVRDVAGRVARLTREMGR